MARKPYDPPFSLRLSFEERARLTAQAEGMALGAYIRSRLLDEPPRRKRVSEIDRDSLLRVLGQLGQSRIANNLNQLARAANLGTLPATPETEDALTYEGEVFALSRLIGVKTKDVTAKLGRPDNLRSVAETKAHIAESIAPRLDAYLKQAKEMAKSAMKPLHDKRLAMRDAHQAERRRMEQGQRERWRRETRERAARLRTGVRGLWDRLTGDRAKVIKQNEIEAYWGLRRDRDQRQSMFDAQHKERRELQVRIRETRERHARQILELYKQAANYRLMRDGNGQSRSIRSEFSRNAGEAREPSGRNNPSRGLELGR